MYDLVLIDSGRIRKHKQQKSSNYSFRGNKKHGSSSYIMITEGMSYVPKTLCIDITNENETSSTNNLIRVLETVKTVECKVISIQLATKKNTKELENICKELSMSGKIIISSLYNGMLASYPASYDCVIGVEVNTSGDSEQYSYSKNKSIQAKFNGDPTAFKFEKEFYYYQGNSKACSLATKKVLEIVKNKKQVNLDYVENMLISSVEFSTNMDERKDQYIIDGVMLLIEEIIGKTLTEQIALNSKMFDKEIGIGKKELNQLLSCLVDKYPGFLKEGYIHLNEIETIPKLSRYITRSIK